MSSNVTQQPFNQMLLAWCDSSQGNPRLLLLEGPAGIGKSHTLRSFTAQTKTAMTLHLSCSGWLAGVLRTCHTALESERDPGFLEAARRVTPELRWAQVAQAPALTDQNALWNAVAHALERLARRVGGLILLLEDLHDASPDDLGALRALYRRVLLGKAPILTVMTSRPGENDLLEGFVQDAVLADAIAPERLPLSNLDEPGMNALLREQLHSEFLPDSLATWLHARTEGHPLHTLELLRFLQDGGALRQAGTLWVFRAPSGKAVPERLEAVLKARLFSVRSDVQAWLGMMALSVLDRSVTASEWSKLTRQSTDRIFEVAHRLEHHGLLREGLEAGETMFSIAHPLYAPLIRAQLPEHELVSMHERAIAIAKNATERARHAQACGHVQTLELTRAALADAQQRFAYTEVISQAESLREFDPNDASTSAVLADALFICGETQRALEVSLEAGNNADALLTRFHILMRLGRFAQALETTMLSKVLASAHPDAHPEPQTGLLVATLNQALALMHLQRLDEARCIVDHLLQEYSEPSARHGKALDILSDIVYSQGDLRASLELGSRAANMLREFGDDKNLAITLSNLGGCCAHFGLWEQGRSVLEEAIDLFTQHGQFQRVMFARNNLGFLLVESGRYREARSLILSVCGQAHTAKESSVEGAAFSSLTDLEWQSGQLELAWKYHQQSRALDQRESESLVDQAHLEALRGNISRALELIHTPQTPFHLKKTPKRARIALLAGQFEQAIQFIDEAETPEDHETHRAQARLLRGLAHHKLGRFKDANQDLLEAEDLAQAGGHTPIAFEANLTLALIEGRMDAARDVLKALEELDARGHTLTVQALLPAQWSQLNTEDKPARELAERTMLRTLGSFSLERDGKTSPWRASKTRELLAHLLVAHLREDGPSVPKAQLIAAIWPDSSNDETSESTFRVTLKRLRESLGDAASIHSTNGIYELRDLNADLTHFLTALERMDFDAALGWYRGAFLPDMDFEDAGIVRAQLWQRFRDTALRASLEQPAQAAANLLEKLHHLEPLDVTLLERLTQSLQAANDPYRLEQTLLRARTVFERETGEVPAELLTL